MTLISLLVLVLLTIGYLITNGFIAIDVSDSGDGKTKFSVSNSTEEVRHEPISVAGHWIFFFSLKRAGDLMITCRTEGKSARFNLGYSTPPLIQISTVQFDGCVRIRWKHVYADY